MKFKRADDKRKTPEQTDDAGIVVVTVTLCHKGHQPTRGNIVRKVRLTDCRVSEVFAAIEAAIISDE
jgi:hypothetical protein